MIVKPQNQHKNHNQLQAAETSHKRHKPRSQSDKNHKNPTKMFKMNMIIPKPCFDNFFYLNSKILFFFIFIKTRDRYEPTQYAIYAKSGRTGVEKRG